MYFLPVLRIRITSIQIRILFTLIRILFTLIRILFTLIRILFTLIRIRSKCRSGSGSGSYHSLSPRFGPSCAPNIHIYGFSFSLWYGYGSCSPFWCCFRIRIQLSLWFSSGSSFSKWSGSATLSQTFFFKTGVILGEIQGTLHLQVETIRIDSGRLKPISFNPDIRRPSFPQMTLKPVLLREPERRVSDPWHLGAAPDPTRTYLLEIIFDFTKKKNVQWTATLKIKKYKIFSIPVGRSRLYQRCYLFYIILTYPFAYDFSLVGPDTIWICRHIFLI
jgi:hypothetical protein